MNTEPRIRCPSCGDSLASGESCCCGWKSERLKPSGSKNSPETAAETLRAERWAERQRQLEEQDRIDDVRRAAFLKANGLETVDQMREWVRARIGKIGHLRQPGEEG
jgi:hypothetical protein